MGKKRFQKSSAPLISELIKWLGKPGNSFASIAVALGYKDSTPIRQWINRNSIPSYQQERVKKIITGELQ